MKFRGELTFIILFSLISILISVFALSNPTISNVILNSTLGTNYTTENLTAYITGENSTRNITDWRINGVSWATLNMPFETNISSGQVRDYSNFSNNATFAGSPTWVNGKVGGAYSFDAGADKLEIPYDDSLNLSNGFSISMWVKVNGPQVSTSYSGIFSNADGITNTGKSFSIWMTSTDEIRIAVSDGVAGQDGYASNTNILGDTDWHYIGFIYDTAVSRYITYIDGSVVGNVSLVREPTGPHTEFFIGRAGSSYPFNGTIDEILLFNRSISVSVLDSIYDQQNAGADLTNLDKSATKDWETWTAMITPNNITQDGAPLLSNEVQIVPISSDGIADLKSDDPYELDSNNLSAYCYGNEGGVYTNLSFYYNVYKNGVLNQSGFTNNSGSFFSSGEKINVINISSDSLDTGDDWRLDCLVNNQQVNGTYSSNLSIRDPKEFFISLTGDDSTGNGSSANPWNTISYALTQIQDLDNLTLKNGTYNLGKNWIERATTIHKRINLKAESNQQVLLNINETSPYGVIYWTDITGGSIDGIVINSTGDLATSNYAIRLDQNISNFTLKNSLLDGSILYSVHLDQANQVTIDNNQFYMDAATENVIELVNTSNVVISNNTFGSISRRIGILPTVNNAILATGGNNNTLVQSNNFYHNMGDSIVRFLSLTERPTRGLIIEDNYFDILNNSISYSIGIGTEASDAYYQGIVGGIVRNNILTSLIRTSGVNHGIFMGHTLNSRA
jgi:hypothetical protein